MKFERFEDIIAWQKAKEMTVSIYKDFFESKDFGFKDQIQRAGVSVMNNNEFIKFIKFIKYAPLPKKYQEYFQDLSKLYEL